MENLNNDIKEIRDLDPISLAEEIVGKGRRNKESNSLGFALHIQKSQLMNEMMDATDDTKFSESASEYMRKITDIGFKVIHEETYKNRDGIDEKFYILWLEEYSILLKFDTFTWGDDGSWAKAGKEVPPPSRNSADFYFNWVPNEGGSFKYTASGTCATCHMKPDFSGELLNPEEKPKYDNENYDEYRKLMDAWDDRDNQFIKDNNLKKVWSGHNDGREAIKNDLNGLLENGVFLKKWFNQPFIWLVTDEETRVAGYDYKALTNNRLAKLPDYVRECIGNEVK